MAQSHKFAVFSTNFYKFVQSLQFFEWLLLLSTDFNNSSKFYSCKFGILQLYSSKIGKNVCFYCHKNTDEEEKVL